MLTDRIVQFPNPDRGRKRELSAVVFSLERRLSESNIDIAGVLPPAPDCKINGPELVVFAEEPFSDPLELNVFVDRISEAIRSVRQSLVFPALPMDNGGVWLGRIFVPLDRVHTKDAPLKDIKREAEIATTQPGVLILPCLSEEMARELVEHAYPLKHPFPDIPYNSRFSQKELEQMRFSLDAKVLKKLFQVPSERHGILPFRNRE